MATEAQIAANRRNALLSTGPKTRHGKEKSRGNAIRSGLYAKDLTALGERGDDFTAYAAELAATLRPADCYEAMLVRRVTLASWRCDRLARLEAALLDGEARAEARRRGHPAELPADVWPDALVPLARQEAALDRAIQRAMNLLERHRAGKTSPLEGEVGVSREAAIRRVGGDRQEGDPPPETSLAGGRRFSPPPQGGRRENIDERSQISEEIQSSAPASEANPLPDAGAGERRDGAAQV